MEGIPRPPMLTPDMRIPDRPLPENFAERLREYIATNYQDNPAKYESSFKEIETMRLTAMRCQVDVEAICILKRYYAQLMMMKKRFPMEEHDSCAIPFSWADRTLDLPTSLVFEDINFELCCVMFNIGASHAIIAAREARSEPDSIKNAFMHWQWAAWPMQQLRDKMSCARFPTTDFDPAFLTFFLNVFLAQGQECMLEKSMIDHRKPTVIAKIATRLQEIYGQCVLHLNNSGLADLVTSSTFKEWVRICTAKYELYRAMAYLYLGHEAEEAKKMGERFAYFALALQHITSACKVAHKHNYEDLKQTMQYAYDVIFQREANARRENEFVYNERVPKAELLAKVEGVSMTKPIGFDPCDPSISGEDLFKELLPADVIRAVSMYSEEKAKFKRSLFQKVESKDQELEKYLLSLHLDQIHLDEPVNQARLPDELLQASAAFSSQPDAFPDLLEKFQEMMSLTSLAGQKLDGMKKRLQAVEDKDLSRDEGFKAIKVKIDELSAHHVKAKSNNEELQRAIAAHSENLKLLAMPLTELSSRVCGAFLDTADTAEGKQLKKMLEKVDEMRVQRCKLIAALNEDLDRDDIAKKALAERELDPGKMFEGELKKHEPNVVVIEQNMLAQDKILEALTAANADFAELRHRIVVANEKKMMESLTLVTAFQVFTDVVEKTNQALDFYKQLFTLLDALSSGVKHIEESRAKLKAEREKIEQDRRAKEICEQTMEEFGIAKASKPGKLPTRPAIPSIHSSFESKPTGQSPMGAQIVPAASRPRLADYIGHYRSDGGWSGANADASQAGGGPLSTRPHTSWQPTTAMQTPSLQGSARPANNIPTTFPASMASSSINTNWGFGAATTQLSPIPPQDRCSPAIVRPAVVSNPAHPSFLPSGQLQPNMQQQTIQHTQLPTNASGGPTVANITPQPFPSASVTNPTQYCAPTPMPIWQGATDAAGSIPQQEVKADASANNGAAVSSPWHRNAPLTNPYYQYVPANFGNRTNGLKK